MSKTNPLLQHAVPAAHSGSEAKVFFTADELLQHVRRKYQKPADTGKQGKRYTRLRAVSPGLYVPPDHTDTKQTHFTDTKKRLRYDEAQLPKSQPCDTNMALFRADGGQHFSTSHSLARDGCAKSLLETERKELTLEDKSHVYQQHNDLATYKKTCATVKLDTKPNRGPQDKISWKARTKTRRISQESDGSIQICFFKTLQNLCIQLGDDRRSSTNMS